MKNVSIRHRIAAVTCGLGLALATTLGAAAPALAATSGTTQVTLEASDDQLEVTVPTTIPMVVNADGTLTGPSEEALRIVNGSNFGIHVETVTAAAESPFTLVADASVADEANAVDMQVTAGTDTIDLAGAASGTATTGANWDMTYASDDAETDQVQLSVAGDAANLEQDISSAQKVATITWAIEAGANA